MGALPSVGVVCFACVHFAATSAIPPQPVSAMGTCRDLILYRPSVEVRLPHVRERRHSPIGILRLAPTLDLGISKFYFAILSP
jgi:hypothetical protein